VRPQRNGLVVLGWHNVGGTWSFPSPAGTGARGLAAQLRWLKRAAAVLDLTTALDMLAAGERLPLRAVAITFDDGYRDNLDIAVPMLEALGLPATFFLAPRLLSGEVAPWWEVLARAMSTTHLERVAVSGESFELTDGQSRQRLMELLKRGDNESRQSTVRELVEVLSDGDRVPEWERDLLLDWPGARQLVDRGFAIGSHSLEHRILANEQADVQFADLRDSKHLLEAGLDVAVRVLAYPNGTWADFTRATEDAARDAGYDYAVTTIAGRNVASTPPLELRRWVMYPERGVTGFGVLLARLWRRAEEDGAPAGT
jgi:peptidoglycan/xylan/chitin deacetylase (PgdA/CDA1 family)